MAARKQLWHPDETKRRIQTSQIINRLTQHALSEHPIMDASQVQAARALIDKVLPNARTELALTGANGGPIQTEDVTNDAAAFARRMAGLAARADGDGAGAADPGGEG